MDSPSDKKRTLIEAYRKTGVVTANKEAVLLLLYSGAVRFLKQAITATETQNIEERTRYILRTQDIVNELRASLNFQIDHEIAEQLDALYGFITHRLLMGNLEKKTIYLEEALKILTTLHEAWESAISSLTPQPTIVTKEGRTK